MTMYPGENFDRDVSEAQLGEGPPAAQLTSPPARLLDLLTHGAGVVGGVAVFCMAFLTTANVIARGVFNRPFLDTVLLGEMAVAALTFLGLAWVFRLGRHVSVSIFVERLPWRARLWIDVVVLTVCLVGFSVAIYETWSFAYKSLLIGERLRGIFRVDAFPFHAMMPFGLGLLSLEIVRRIVLDVRALRRNRPDISPAWHKPDRLIE